MGLLRRTSGIPGLAGPVIFTALVVLQGLLQPDYSHAAMPISALAAWPLGWLQNLNFCLFASLMIAHALDLHHGIARARRDWVGPAFLVLSGIGVFVSAAFPWERHGDELVEPGGHVVGAVMSFLGAGIGLVALSRRMTRDPAWAPLSGYTLASGVTMLSLFFAFAALAVSPTAPLHPWAGLMQRIIAAVWLTCTIVLALRLRRLSASAASRGPAAESDEITDLDREK